MPSVIHPTAQVSPKAELGNDVHIGPGVIVEDKVVIGDGARIGPYAVVMDYTRIGRACVIHAHAVLGDFPQDTTFQNQPSFLEIGERCWIREGVTMHRGTKPETSTTVGSGCLLMANSHVAHNCRLEQGVIIANGALLGGYAEVGERAFISGNVLVHQFCRVGKLAMLSGGSGFNKDVPPFCTTAPMEVNTIVGLNVVGMRRAGYEPALRAEIRRAFKVLFCSGLNVSQALERLRNEFVSDIVRDFADFISVSKRGICAYSSHGNASDEAGGE